MNVTVVTTVIETVHWNEGAAALGLPVSARGLPC